MKKNSARILLGSLLVLCFFHPHISFNQGGKFAGAAELVPHVDVSLSPRTGSFVEGSTFQVPILINTKGSSVNGIDLKITFDASKLSIVQPSNGKSIVGVWVEPTTYDNVRGTASFVGVIPEGVMTSSGLIGTITFVAKSSGVAAVGFKSNSAVLLNDGLGSNIKTNFIKAEYEIVPRPPEGVTIYSATHPSQDAWYNNNSPFFTWEKEPGVTGFSYVLDTKPSTVPENNVLTTETSKAYENLKDGLYYFHVKALKNSVWGTTGTFLVRIDTTPPASFTPRAEYVVAAVVAVERTLLSFFTTDNLSGIDHYEVGIIDKSQPVTESPVFTIAESPFQVPLQGTEKLRVIVRAFDKAGNVQDESVDVEAPFIITKFVTDYIVYILLGIILLGFVMLIMHYLFGHKLLAHVRRALTIVREEEATERAKNTEENNNK